MLGGLAARMPRLSAGALALCLAAAALPPFGSFVAELMLVQSALAAMATRRRRRGGGWRRRAHRGRVRGGPRRLCDGATVRVRVPRRTAVAGRSGRDRAGGIAPPAGAGAGRRRAGARPPVAVAGIPLPGPLRRAHAGRRGAGGILAGAGALCRSGARPVHRRRDRRGVAAPARARPAVADPPLPHVGLRSAHRRDDGVHGHRVLGARPFLPARHRPRREAPRVPAGRAVQSLDQARARWSSGRRAACWPDSTSRSRA